jgi:hypothetical protein
MAQRAWRNPLIVRRKAQGARGGYQKHAWGIGQRALRKPFFFSCQRSFFYLRKMRESSINSMLERKSEWKSRYEKILIQTLIFITITSSKFITSPI